MIKRFNRFEIKYAIPVAALRSIKADLLQFLRADPHGNDHGFYSVASLYLDTPDDACFANKLDGLRYRRKLRIRVYPDRPGGPAFVEIKQRVNRTVQKRRLALPLADAYALCAGTAEPELEDPEDREVADEVRFLVRSLRLRPRTVVAYTRQAFVGHIVDPGLRLTFDTMIRSRRAGFDLEQRRRTAVAFPFDQAVMEVKANERVPHWLTGLLARHQCTLTRVSKYCHAAAANGRRERVVRTLFAGGTP